MQTYQKNVGNGNLATDFASKQDVERPPDYVEGIRIRLVPIGNFPSLSRLVRTKLADFSQWMKLAQTLLIARR